MENKFIFIQRFMDELPKTEEGTLACIRYHVVYNMFTDASDVSGGIVLLNEYARLEFDTEVAPEGNRKFPQKFLPVENMVVTKSDNRHSCQALNLMNEDIAKNTYIHSFTPYLSEMSIFDEFDPDKVMEMSNELRKLSR